MMNGYEYLVFGLVLLVCGAIFFAFGTKSGVGESQWFRWLFLWPVLIDFLVGRKSGGSARSPRLVVLALIALFALMLLYWFLVPPGRQYK